MKVAFPVKEDKGLDSPMNDHFGVARYFMVVDLETRDFDLVENRKVADPKAGCKTGVFEKSEARAIDAVVTKCIGDGGQRGLTQKEIQVYAAQEDTVAGNLALLEKGDLKLFHMFDLCQGKKNKKTGGCGHHH